MTAKLTKRKLYWRIEGYDGLKPIYGPKTIRLGQFTVDQIKHLLQALAATAGLSYDEIVGAYARRGTKIANNHLVVEKEFELPAYTCGSNPHFTAAVVDENGRMLRH
jgi:hypothetical protein